MSAKYSNIRLSLKDKKKPVLCILAYWTADLSYRLFRYLDGDLFQIANNAADNEYLYLIFYVISDLLACLLLPIENKVQKAFHYEYSSTFKLLNMKNKLIFLGLFSLEVLARFSNFIFYKWFKFDRDDVSKKFSGDFIIFLNIGFTFIFYFIFYKDDFYRHKKCSTIFTMITFLFMLIFDIINMIFIKNYNLSNCFYYILITSIKGIAFPFVDTIARKMRLIIIHFLTFI